MRKIAYASFWPITFAPRIAEEFASNWGYGREGTINPHKRCEQLSDKGAARHGILLSPTSELAGKARQPMNGQYPRFKNSYFYEEFTENFLLTPAELEFVRNCRGDANRQGMAILLKGLQYLGYFPESLQQVPGSIRSFMGKQLGLLTDFINQYPWETSTRERHLAQIREFTGWRSMTSQDKEEIEQWLRQDGCGPQKT
jgi:Domain of unknown function (DUF4158)